MANRIFIDMDGVMVDFDRFRDERGLTGDQVKAMPGAYLAMPAIPGAIEAVRSLIGMGFDVFLATKPPTAVAHAYSDKAAWVLQNLPELKRKIIITHDKGLLGDDGDYLCDDRPHKANCEQFAGTLLRFVDGFHWPQALEFFRGQRDLRAHVPAKSNDPEDGERWRWFVRHCIRIQSLDMGGQHQYRLANYPFFYMRGRTFSAAVDNTRTRMAAGSLVEVEQHV